MTLHSRNRRGAAQRRSVTEITPKSRFLCANRSPIQYGFRAGANSIPYSVNILNLILFLSHAHKLKFEVYLPYQSIAIVLSSASLLFIFCGLSFLYPVSFVAQLIGFLSHAIIAGQLSREKRKLLSGKRSMWIAKLAVDFPKKFRRFLCVTLAGLVRISEMILVELVAHQS